MVARYLEQTLNQQALEPAGLWTQPQGPRSAAFEESLKEDLSRLLPHLEWLGPLPDQPSKGPDKQWLTLQYDLSEAHWGLELSVRLIQGLRFPGEHFRRSFRVVRQNLGPAPKVAVAALFGPEVESPLRAELSQQFRSKLFKQTGPQWLQSMQEQGPQGCFVVDCARALAQPLGADLLVLPSLEIKGKLWTLSAWVYEAAGDRPVALEEVTLKDPSRLSLEVRHLAHQLVRRHRVWFAPKPKTPPGERAWSPPVLYQP